MLLIELTLQRDAATCSDYRFTAWKAKANLAGANACFFFLQLKRKVSCNLVCFNLDQSFINLCACWEKKTFFPPVQFSENLFSCIQPA